MATLNTEIPAVRIVSEPGRQWPFSARGTAVRLFLTCWLIYVLHFASNSVREVYLGLAIGDHFSFRVDDYAHMHPDLFEKPGFGWHIGANPGASMLAAVPYALARPLIDPVVNRVNAARRTAADSAIPEYKSPWPMARSFFQEAWRRGLDVKLGLGAFVMQSLCMAPISALGVVAMFFLLRTLFSSTRAALWLALLYAVGTPVFFRTGYLNHNMMLGHFAFFGFITMWNPAHSARWGDSLRYWLGGLAGGAALLFDYSGVVLLAGLFLYGVARAPRLRLAALFAAGAAVPIALLWFYQWQSFGNPFLPGQHWMPPVEWIDRGYQGFGWPQGDLLFSLLFDYRYGLFVSCPLMLFALAYPFAKRLRLPGRELWFALAFSVGLVLFCAGINYTRLQFNSGIRYLAPVLPFLFVPAAAVLMHVPKRAFYFIAVISVVESWCLAMHRDVERGLGVLDPVLSVFIGGFQLPFLTVLSRLSGQYGEYSSAGVSPLPLLALCGVIIYGIWRKTPRAKQIHG